MSRTAWPELPHHRLNTLAEEFHLSLNHHNAIGDASACAELVLLCADQMGANNIAELRGMLAIRARRNAEAARILKDGGEVKTGDDLGAVGYEDVVVDGKVIYGKAWLDFTVDNYKDDPYITG